MFPRSSLPLLAAAAFLCALAAAGCGGTRPAAAPSGDPDRGAEHRPVFVGEAEREGEGEEEGGPAAAEVAARAYPRSALSATRAVAAGQAFGALPESPPLRASARAATSLPTVWRELGPASLSKPPLQTYPSPATLSGRITALAIDPACGQAGRGCRLWVAAAGGGVWRTDDAKAAAVRWTHASTGLDSNAIGAIVVDPNDPSGDTLYAGTGEDNVSSDAEAGIGLYRSTDGGDHWALVPGSRPVARDRSIGAIAIPEGEPGTIYIGTTRGRHGRAGFGGGSDFTPPNAPELGIYASDDGGETFEPSLEPPTSGGDPATGEDTQEGGVTELLFAPDDPETLYAAVYGDGIQRLQRDAVDPEWEQVFAPDDMDDTTRTEFDVTRVDDQTVRLYAVASVDGGVAYRVEDEGATQTRTQISSTDPAESGFGGGGICASQCDYDLVVRAQQDDPDVVWIGGVAQWDEIPPMSSDEDRAGASNGRSVVRSTDEGVTWSDMTAGGLDDPTDFDGTEARMNGAHPDLHAIVLDPSAPASAFVAGDGGLVRTSAELVDRREDCPDTLDAAYEARCDEWLWDIPAHVYDLNEGLATLQFQRVSVAPDGSGALLGGTQDNGSMASSGTPSWTGFAQGDGGGNGFDAADPNVRWHTYTGAAVAINTDFAANPTGGWTDVPNELVDAQGDCRERCAFYPPFLADPRVGSRAQIGMQRVWRTVDRGAHWAPLGEDLTDGSLGDEAGGYVSAIGRSVGDTGTMWAATSRGRIFVTRDSDAADPADVAWARVDDGGAALPTRYPTQIAVDPEDPLHAFVTFTGYDAYTPSTPGHVFEARVDPDAGTATFADISADLGDVPALDVVYDPVTKDLWLATDFGVARRPGGETGWKDAAQGMPYVAVYGLAVDPVGRTIYAATHGRGVFQIDLPGPPFVPPAPVQPGVTPAPPPDTGRGDQKLPDEPARGATPPAAAAAPTRPAQPAPRIAFPVEHRRLVAQRDGDVRIVLGRFSQPATGRIEILVRRGAARRTQRLAARSFHARAGQAVRVTPRLNRSARTLLRRRGRLVVTVRVVARGAGGRSAVRTYRVTLRAPRG